MQSFEPWQILKQSLKKSGYKLSEREILQCLLSQAEKKAFSHGNLANQVKSKADVIQNFSFRFSQAISRGNR